jgi:hypothetical protein
MAAIVLPEPDERNFFRASYPAKNFIAQFFHNLH